MSAVVSFVVPILETLAARCALPALFYLCEVAEDGSVLPGVELELPMEDVDTVPRRKFFWSAAWRGYLDAYDHAAMQAISFLQGLYGFVVRDYNYDCMMAYRDSMRSAVLVTVSAARYAARLEREASRPLSSASAASGSLLGPLGGQATIDWNLLCSCLMASVRYV
ncbi:unnamed protein product [Alopecurus aequalis]